MKKIYTAVVLSLATVITGCGGGGNSSNNNKNVALKGTVPGTLIEAFCDDKSYHKTNSINNGTTKHPFAINLPKGVACRVIMTIRENDPTNKIITPILFKKGSKKTNAIKLFKDTDIGYVPLPQASTSQNDKNSDHIKDEPLEVDISNHDLEVLNDIDSNPFDKNHDGLIDGYEDKDHNGILDGFEDKNRDGKVDINEDSNKNGIPDGYEVDDNNESRGDRDNN